MASERPSVFSAEKALELQSYLGRRLQESKTCTTAEGIQQAMNDLCADILAYLEQWVKIGKRSTFGEGCILYWVEQYWTDLTPLHDQYASFHDFADQETGEDYATYRMKINVYRTFVLNEKKDPMVAEYGPDAFMDVPFGKLQKALGAVRRGDMTQERWAALMDPNVRDREFYHIMRALPAETSSGEQDDRFVDQGGDPEVTISMEDGTLRYWPGGGQVGIVIGRLEVNARDDSVKEAVDEIIDAAGIRRV